MIARRTLSVAALAVLPALGFAAPAAAEVVCPEFDFPDGAGNRPSVAANLDGSQVVPAPGDPDGTGTVIFTLQGWDQKIANVAFQFSSNGVALPLEGAHLHKAPPGETWVSGIQVFGWSDQADRSGVITMSKCTAHDMFRRPADFYVDVHNWEYPDQGAIRGQLGDAR